MIFDEVTRGDSVQTLNESMRVLIDATHQSFAETMKGFEIAAGRITIQQRENKKAQAEIERKKAKADKQKNRFFGMMGPVIVKPNEESPVAPKRVASTDGIDERLKQEQAVQPRDSAALLETLSCGEEVRPRPASQV